MMASNEERVPYCIPLAFRLKRDAAEMLPKYDSRSCVKMHSCDLQKLI